MSWTVEVGNVTDGDGCDIVNRFVTLTLPDSTFQVFGPFNLPAGTAVSAVGSLNYTTDAADIGQIGVPGAWTATISWTGTLLDGFDQPSTGTKQLSISPLYPDVSVLKTADATPINAGANASFTIVVTNHGPGSATNVTLTDTLPGTGWTEGSASCTITPGANDVLNCSFGTLAQAATASVTVSRATTVADCGTLPNTATVTADNDSNSTNNSSQASIVVNCPDVSVLKTAVDPSIDAGENASFTILVTNNGPGSATDVTLTDTLPGTGWTEDSASCSITPGANDVLNCNFGTLAFPGSASVTVSRATSTADCGAMTNTATVSATGDTNAGNNSSTATIEVVCGGEGCTPGFWRQEQHFQYWTGYTPGQSFETVFSVDVTLRGTGKTEYTNPTLLQAVWANGGDVNALARHAVAALLNSTSPEVDYAYSTAEVIQMVHDAISGIGTLSIEDVHQLLAAENEMGCGVDTSNSPPV